METGSSIVSISEDWRSEAFFDSGFKITRKVVPSSKRVGFRSGQG
jgi:hypothetical protein